MNKSLEQVKAELSEEYLGRDGIHGIGFRRSQNAIVVYVEKNKVETRNKLEEELKNKVKPYRIILVEDESPKIT